MSPISPRAVFGGLIALAVFVYPFVVYLLIDTISPIWFGAILVGLIALRVWPLLRTNSVIIALVVFGIAFLGLLRWTGDAFVLQLYPTIASLFLLLVFGYSLIKPSSVIERFAVRAGMEPNVGNIAYTRVVTMVWCGFFAFNAIVSAGVTLTGSMAAWALYNGLLSYLLIGLIFSAEFLYRQHYFRQQGMRSRAG